jgi:hypothetical protein
MDYTMATGQTQAPRKDYKRATMRHHMPKTSVDLEESFRFRLSKADRREFEEAAAKMSISLSAWLRIAGKEKLERERDKKAGK